MLRSLQYIRKARTPRKPRRMEALASQMESVLSFGFRSGLTKFGSRVSHADMVQAINSGDYRNVMEVFPWNDLQGDLSGFASSLANAAAKGSKYGATEIDGAVRGRSPKGLPKDIANTLAMTPKNPAISSYVSTRTGELIQNVTLSLQATVQRELAANLSKFESPSDMAQRLVEKNLPLNDRQSLALSKYSESIWEQHGNTKVGQKLVNQYAATLQQQRAMSIARTESSFALNHGQQLAWQSAKDQAILPPTSMQEWVTEVDPCNICLSLNGQQVGLHEQFEDEEGELYSAPPAHTNCRCLLALI